MLNRLTNYVINSLKFNYKIYFFMLYLIQFLIEVLFVCVWIFYNLTIRHSMTLIYIHKYINTFIDTYIYSRHNYFKDFHTILKSKQLKIVYSKRKKKKNYNNKQMKHIPNSLLKKKLKSPKSNFIENKTKTIQLNTRQSF